MKIELMTIPHCPGAEDARRLLRESGESFVETTVQNQAKAEAVRFLGSPTIQIDGVDIEPERRNDTPSFSCRTYAHGNQRLCKVPGEMLRAALAEARSPACPSSAEHWDRIFGGTEDAQLGWYEAEVAPTLGLIKKIPDWKTSTIFLPGAGTSLLVDTLLAEGARLILNDISPAALDRLRQRIGDTRNRWLCQDIAQPLPSDLPPVDIWIDRAVLHFLTAENQIEAYFRNLDGLLKPGGYALFAEFSPDGAEKCAGLELHHYSLAELTRRLGVPFLPIESFRHTYHNPDGDPRPYLYALYRK